MGIWKQIPGYEGLYEVSDGGQVKSLPRNTTRGGILKQVVAPPGYLTVKLWQNGVGKTKRVHSLVMLAFVGPLPEGRVTRHLNGDPHDNRIENLGFGTYRENNIDAVRHRTNANTRKTHCKHGHEFTVENTVATVSGRQCRTCAKATKRAWYERKKAGCFTEGDTA